MGNVPCGFQIVDKVGKMETVENFLRQGAAESQLVSDLLDRDPAGLKPATQYEGVLYGLKPTWAMVPCGFFTFILL